MSRSLTQAEFQSTMTFLLSFVKKDKYVFMKWIHAANIHSHNSLSIASI
jgi:hypothetical protein